MRKKFADSLAETASELENQVEETFGKDGTFSKIIDDHFGENGKIVKQIARKGALSTHCASL